MPAPRPTPAAIRRAIEGARAAGAAEVRIEGPVIRILVSPAPGPLPSPGHEDDEATCDEIFGARSG